MKTRLKLFFLFFFFFGSAFSNSNELKFEWTLKQNENPLLGGRITSSTRISHSDALTLCNSDSSEYDCFTRLTACCTGSDFATYNAVSSTKVIFDQNKPDFNMPLPFSILLGSCGGDLHHRFKTSYLLRGQSMTTACNLALSLCYICCFPCFITCYLCTAGACCASYHSKVRRLERAVPNNLPGHVTISERSLSHTAQGTAKPIMNLSNTTVIDDNTHIFDIFLNTPETHQWLIDHLNPTANITLSILIPELFNTASSAQVIIQEQKIENNSENMTPSHFLTFKFENGITVQYHLNQSSTNDIQILAIVITINNYALTLNVQNYNAVTNCPPPHYNTLSTTTCNCNGACACANFSNNDTDHTDDSGSQNSNIRNHVFFPHASY